MRPTELLHCYIGETKQPLHKHNPASHLILTIMFVVCSNKYLLSNRRYSVYISLHCCGLWASHNNTSVLVCCRSYGTVQLKGQPDDNWTGCCRRHHNTQALIQPAGLPNHTESGLPLMYLWYYLQRWISCALKLNPQTALVTFTRIAIYLWLYSNLICIFYWCQLDITNWLIQGQEKRRKDADWSKKAVQHGSHSHILKLLPIKADTHLW